MGDNGTMNASFSAPLSTGLEALLASQPQQHEVQTEAIEYSSGGVDFGGFVARPAANAERSEGVTDALLPAVLVISDWSGLNDHARVRATMLARLGYIALAGDIYGGGVELSPAEAGPAA